MEVTYNLFLRIVRIFVDTRDDLDFLFNWFFLNDLSILKWFQGRSMLIFRLLVSLSLFTFGSIIGEDFLLGSFF